MILEELDLLSAPGLPGKITLADLRPGLVLLVGPNASGKSTIGRTLRGTLWPEHALPAVDARTRWRRTVDGPPLRATLVFGRTGWDDDAPGIPAELAAVWNLTLEDMLRGDASSDSEIARRVQTQLAGGYDLSVIGPAQAPRIRPVPSVHKPFEEASQELRRLLAVTDGLADQEARLAELELVAKNAAEAPAELETVRKARRRLAVRRRLGELQGELATLPSKVATLPPRADETARELVEETRRRLSDHAERGLRHAACEAATDNLAFPGGDPGEAVVVELVARSKRLVEAQRQEIDQERACDLLRGRRDEAASQVWTPGSAPGLPSSSAVEALCSVTAKLASARAHLDGLAVPTVGGDRLADLARETLGDARSLLRQWLSTPREVVVAGGLRPNAILPLGLGAVGLCLVVVGTLLAILVSPGPGLATLAVGLAFAGGALGLWFGPGLATPATHASGSDIDALERRYEQHDYPPVDSWAVPTVEAVLDDIDARLRAHEQAVAAAREGEHRREERRRATEQVAALERELAATAATFGLSEEMAGLSLSIQADRILSLARARQEHAAAKEALRGARERLQQDLVVCRDTIVALGVEGLPALDSANAILQAAEALHRRRDTWITERDRLRDAVDELERAGRELAAAEGKRDAHLRACGVGLEELDSLRDLTASRAVFEELETERGDLERELARLDVDVPSALAQDDAALAAEEERLEASGGELARLMDQISAIRQQVESATRGHTIQETLARKEAALDSLVADRDTHLEHRAAAALVAWLRRQRSEATAPELLARARRWFLRFTRNRYELLVADAGRFEALDTHTHRRQSLSELSAGTRIQLLLAARLSFVEHIEQGGAKIPLFLDEVLSTTDPVRFEAVATSILELAADGRQVFYATAGRTEAAAWSRVAEVAGFDAPQLVVLGAAETHGSWASVPALPDRTPDPPSPEGHDAISYVAALGLHRPALRDPIQRWPLALVLHDRLAAAAAAFGQGVRYVGQLALAEKGLSLPLDDEDLALALARARALSAAMDATRVGRGEPVTWQVVDESGTVSATFAERVRAQLAIHQDDAGAFVAAVRAIPSFRNSRADQLEAHLVDVGVLDPREILTEEAVVERTQVACRDDIEAGRLTLADVEILGRWLREVVAIEA